MILTETVWRLREAADTTGCGDADLLMDDQMTMDEARSFAEEWIAAWNSRDLERILSHYATNVVFCSPFAQKRIGNGRVEGIEELRRYWGEALAAQPNLKFELTGVRVGFRCLTILYRNHRGQDAAETCEFGASHKVVRSFACYG
jgi:hypothetical protein